ncbi:putative lipoprotein [Clostridium argentinense CDC 2741]|uniref:Putative lipoprotein n=1 Tax=Clostridium argentinense CDC 2741 TaxID=1418104 RepID=A0A0C1U232_9CLOT|nr:hypothetical protein [Clostridium argentinense]ARC86717.1 hypothetical protein RSJ17_20595 [Clostridium argentinense]KIE45583.1 putative lipoprotein [Clostridium argentinense CDC 2741]NFF38462.1 hypothetical protein [Clostridium argentinense]NFP49345.1 hypothetical protein [Clostridium argentinense]NFP71748.1 hypothetical protein [Clostridium argentinense]
MNKKILCTVVLLSLTTQLISCKQREEETVKRIVIESDVRDQKLGEKNKNPKVTVEKINLKLDEGDYFEPAFYHEGEVYGAIDKGCGPILGETSVTHPIAGYMKEYLYKVDENNNLIKTSKEVFNRVWGPKMIGFKLLENDKVFSIDYKKEDKIKEIPELTKIINELKERSEYDSACHIRLNSDDENYVEIYITTASNKEKLYLYDMKNKKLHDVHDKEYEKDGCLNTLHYVDSLQSLVWINKDLKVYKLKLEKENAFFESYINLDKYIGSNQKGKIDNVRGVMINSDEMLIFQDEYISEQGPYLHFPLHKTISISKFNFKTNQYRVLFEVPDGINMWAKYIGNNMLGIEEFKQNEKNMESIIPINRYIKEIRNDGLNVIYKEKTEDEGETSSPEVYIALSEDGTELFLARHLTKFEDDTVTTEDIVYKKYKIEY